MVSKTNLKDELRTSLEDALSVCGLSDMKMSSQVILKSSLGDNPVTGLEDGLIIHACDKVKTFSIMCLEIQRRDVLKTSIEDAFPIRNKLGSTFWVISFQNKHRTTSEVITHYILNHSNKNTEYTDHNMNGNWKDWRDYSLSLSLKSLYPHFSGLYISSLQLSR